MSMDLTLIKASRDILTFTMRRGSTHRLAIYHREYFTGCKNQGEPKKVGIFERETHSNSPKRGRKKKTLTRKEGA